jgi:hypothetical protein
MVKKFSAFYGKRKFITAFTTSVIGRYSEPAGSSPHHYTLYFPNAQRNSSSSSLPYLELIHDARETALNRICILLADETQVLEMMIFRKYVTLTSHKQEVNNIDSMRVMYQPTAKLLCLKLYSARGVSVCPCLHVVSRNNS